MRKTRAYFWYVQPLDSLTNRVFSTELPTENACLRGQKVPEGMYLCPDRATVQRFWDSREDQHLNFKVFSAAEGSSKGTRDARIRECTFLFKKNGGHKKPRQKPKKVPAKTAANAASAPL